MKLMIVHGMLVCSSFLIGVCMFIVSKALLISSATVIVLQDPTRVLCIHAKHNCIKNAFQEGDHDVKN